MECVVSLLLRQLGSDAGRTRRREAERSDEEETRKRTGGEEVGVRQSWGEVGERGGKTTGKGEKRKGIRTGAAWM